MDVRSTAISKGLKAAFDFAEKHPEENIPKVMGFMDIVLPKNVLANERDAVRKSINDPESNWYKLVLSLFRDIDRDVLRTLFTNLIINASALGTPVQNEYKEKYDCNVPWAILMDPTSACNLHCTGCWAAEYGNQMNLTYEEMDSIISQGKEMGTRVYLFTGGEPLVRKKDLLRLCETHSDCVFSAFTNGTLIDEEFADGMLRVKNFVPAISIEGFESSTDSRRGDGTYRAVLRAMEILKRKKLPFGISCCYTRANAEVIGSEEYFDLMIELGAKFAWFFTYMPVGKSAVPELMATAEQREMMYYKIREYRRTKPLFTVDFWNDGEYVGGCIAGGRSYCHINAGGDVEPCAFIHYSDSNIREKTLLEAYRSPLFMGYRRNQPFNENMLRPCPVLDNPGRLTQIVEQSGARSTDYQDVETAKEYSDKCIETAAEWAPVADYLWKCSGKCTGCGANKN